MPDTDTSETTPSTDRTANPGEEPIPTDEESAPSDDAETTPPEEGSAAPATLIRRDRLAGLETLALIAVGGFAGSNLRYLADTLLSGSPLSVLGGTLLANTLGSAALGFLLYEAIHAELLGNRTRFVLGTGFLSSFTTYSTFALQSAQAGSVLLVILNVLANYGLGFLGVLLGRELARRIEGGGR